MRIDVRSSTALLLVTAALGAGACGDDESTSDATPTIADTPAATATTPAPEPATATTPQKTGTTATAPKIEISKNLEKKPAIPKPTGDPPSELVVQDVVKGTGKGAKAGDMVTVDYVGVSYSTGEQFDASWDRGEPFQFQLGSGGVIGGWDQGVVGMKKGGRRLLVIPPELGYGAQGTQGIAPNETLMFVIDLKKLG